ncbi:MAG: PilT/PilU family type 4a pilus ATPase [Nannocystaceae bacterium]
MRVLEQYLAYLERENVQELVLQTGRAVFIRLDGQYRPVTQDPLLSTHILTLWADTNVATALRQPTLPSQIETTVGNTPYSVSLSRRSGQIQLRVTKGTARQEATPPTPTHASTSPSIRTTTDTAPRTRGDTDTRTRAHNDTARGWLAAARRDNASDVHLVSDRPPAFRLNGELLPQGSPLPHADLEALIHELLSEACLQQLDERGYADSAATLDGAGRVRINACRQQNGLKLCCRLVSDRPPSVEEIGLPDEVIRVQDQHQGLAVISGPNGHGKTTTMSALVDLLNRHRAIHIITVEDPVEIIHPIKRAIVNQREVGTHTASFHRALKAALREDPDVIVIGELRDRETVEIALSAAETGHLVLATMSTPSGATTIDRLIDMFPPDEQTQVRAALAATLKIVASQRLVPRADGNGRVAAIELISGSIALSNLIRENKLFQLPSLLQRGRAYGMIRLEDSLSALLRENVITQEAALAFADDPRIITRSAQKSTTGTPHASEDGGAKRKKAEKAEKAEKRGALRGLFGGRGES